MSAGDELARRRVLLKQVPSSDPSAQLEELLKSYSVTKVGRQTWIVGWKKRPGEFGLEIEMLTPTAFGQFYHPYHFLEKHPRGGARRVAIAEKFMDTATRYHGLVYAPGEGPVVEGHLNMWRGFAIEECSGEWPIMRAHIRDVLAAGDDEADTYIFNWCAWAVQHPGERAEAALTLRGKKGTGKGTLGNAMCKIFGSHGKHISSKNHLVGSFNMHLAYCSLLFADEAYWPGDKQGEGTLKRCITEPTLTIEPKGVDLFEVRNCLHIIIGGNEEWVVPASGDERRFAVFEVSEVRRKDEKYFNALYRELETGGLESMLYDFHNHDLGDWHPRDNIPQGSGLSKQKAHSRHGVEALIEQVAQNGYLPCATFDTPDITNTTGEEKREGFYYYAKTTIPGLQHKTARQITAALREWGCTPHKGHAARGIRFPPLAELRHRFDETQGAQEWDSPNAEWTYENG